MRVCRLLAEERGIGGSRVVGLVGGGQRTCRISSRTLPAPSLERHERRVCVVSGKSGVLDGR